MGDTTIYSRKAKRWEFQPTIDVTILYIPLLSREDIQKKNFPFAPSSIENIIFSAKRWGSSPKYMMKIKCKCGTVVVEGEIVERNRKKVFDIHSNKPKGTIIKNKSNDPKKWNGVCSGCQR